MSAQFRGISWWLNYPLHPHKRVFISDHLVQSITSANDNMVEARLHFLALQKCHQDDEESHRFFASDGLPKRLRPVDDLNHRLFSLHLAGFFRAIGSALDCMASCIVGCTSFPTDIVKADWKGLISKKLAKPIRSKLSSTHLLLLENTIKEMTNAEEVSGPNGWLDWTLCMRNMYVHRARRLNHGNLHPRRSGILNRNLEPIYTTGVVQHLPTAPNLSDIEIFSADKFQPVLNESHLTTTDGVWQSAIALLAQMANYLMDVWEARKKQPMDTPQPDQQWNARNTNSGIFTGYRPGEAPFEISSIIGSPNLINRMQWAALDDANRAFWK